MKYDLEDLLQKTYAHKEKPAREFCQSVICEMKAKEKASSFCGIGSKKPKIMLAVACIVLVLLVGSVFKNGQKSPSENRAPIEQAAGGIETQAPKETGIPTDTDFTHDVDETSSKQDASFSDDSSGKGQKTSGTGKKQAPSSTAKPAGWVLQTRVTMAPAATPHHRRTMAPAITPRPEKTPSADMPEKTPPANTPIPEETPPSGILKPTADYASLCSIETSAYAFDEVHSSGEGVDVVAEFWGDLFYNRMIVSYEELQSLLQEVEKKADKQLENVDFQKAIGQLEQYDREYFASNVLCINLFHLDKGCELKLEKVFIVEKGSGMPELNIHIQIIPGRGGEDEKQYYNCLVQVPKVVAQNCGIVNMNQTDAQ